MSQQQQNDHWKADFYKNGKPKEIIVIEDTPPPSEEVNNKSNYRVEVLSPGPPAASTRSKRTRATVQENLTLPSVTNKKRKTNVTAAPRIAQGKQNMHKKRLSLKKNLVLSFSQFITTHFT